MNSKNRYSNCDDCLDIVLNGVPHFGFQLTKMEIERIAEIRGNRSNPCKYQYVPNLVLEPHTRETCGNIINFNHDRLPNSAQSINGDYWCYWCAINNDITHDVCDDLSEEQIIRGAQQDKVITQRHSTKDHPNKPVIPAAPVPQTTAPVYWSTYPQTGVRQF